MVAFAFHEAYHHLIALILYVMAIQIVLDLRLDFRIVGIKSRARDTRIARSYS
jgi:hypothetical protein